MWLSCLPTCLVLSSFNPSLRQISKAWSGLRRKNIIINEQSRLTQYLFLGANNNQDIALHNKD